MQIFSHTILYTALVVCLWELLKVQDPNPHPEATMLHCQISLRPQDKSNTGSFEFITFHIAARKEKILLNRLKLASILP